MKIEFALPSLHVPPIPRLRGHSRSKRAQFLLETAGGVLPLDPSLIAELLRSTGNWRSTDPTNAARGWIRQFLEFELPCLCDRLDVWTASTATRAHNRRNTFAVIAPSGTSSLTVQVRTSRLIEEPVIELVKGYD